MSKIDLDLKNELQGKGFYNFEGTWYGLPYTPAERLSTPITPRENIRRCFHGEAPKWLPDGTFDQVDITPDCIPDVVAGGYEGGVDTFGVKWIPLENGLPAMVPPGNPLLTDIADWSDLIWPDVASWDWDACGKQYQQTLGTDRWFRGVIMSSYFERLIALMDFEAAAMALLEDPEAVAAFFDKLTDFHIEMIDHYQQHFKVDSIMMHDDWAAQRSPFFSIKVVRELFVPQYQKLVKHCHEKGLKLILHTCGNVRELIPAMIEAGLDGLQIQENAINLEEVIREYGDAISFEAYFDLPMDDAEAKAFIAEKCRIMGQSSKSVISFYDMNETRGFDVRRSIYENERIVVN
jgi:hypothetical protein